MLALLLVSSQATGQEANPDGPSFNCELAKSAAEIIICAVPELAARDRALAKSYADARARAATWSFASDGPADAALQWFETDRRTEWEWREKNCKDVACLERWYVKRKAVLDWIAYSDDGLGDTGIEDIRQLEDGSVLIAYGMATHTRNVLWSVAANDYKMLPDGDITFLSERPILFKVEWSKAYWKEGGAFWFDSIRDENNAIISITAPEDGGLCMSREEFLLKSNFTAEMLRLVTASEVCVRT